MVVRPRTLIRNSIGSIMASGMLIFSTLLIPAILARALERGEFDAYSIVLAALPLLLVVPQSMRTVGATQLALATASHGEATALSVYTRFVLAVAAAHALISVIGIEIHAMVDHQAAAGSRFGLYCILAYTLGIMAVGLAVAPSAARRDFLPDNLAKLWPGLFQLAGIATVFIAGLTPPLGWIFVTYVASSWTIAAVLLVRGMPLRTTVRDCALAGPMRDLFHGFRGVLWWNLTAYVATTAAIMVVAIGFPDDIVPFSIAASLLGLVSAALVAVSGPVAVHAAAAQQRAASERRRFFLVINSVFQGYIAAAALAVALAPVALYALWLTPDLAGDVKRFILLLLPATVIRLLTMNFTIFVMSAGQQRSLWLSPLVEAVLSLAGSLILASQLGVVGIPLALGVSAIVRLALTILHDEPLTRPALGLMPGDVLFSVGRLGKARAC